MLPVNPQPLISLIPIKIGIKAWLKKKKTDSDIAGEFLLQYRLENNQINSHF
jgi:cadmium resistance protein CadD (predicted permease)